jgi:hypothetical protein
VKEFPKADGSLQSRWELYKEICENFSTPVSFEIFQSGC